jgi:cysteine/glycine-rich protein
MPSKFGGGGQSCQDCGKTVYPAEAIQFDQKVFHAACFKCSKCNKNNLAPSDAAQFDNKVFCRMCFNREGFAQKQAAVKWESKGTGSNSMASRFGGGGTSCVICSKTVYPAETLQYEQRAYHHDCFSCNKCQKKITVQTAESFDGTVFCRMCFERDGMARKQTATAKKGGGSGAYNPRFAQFGGGGNKCVTCDKTVYPAETVQFEGRPYHSKCFKCNNCNKEMEPIHAEWSGEQKKAYCKKCFMQLGLHNPTIHAHGTGGGGGGGETPAS